MEKLIKTIQAKWSKLSRRESYAVIAGMIAAVFILWNLFIYGPYRENAGLLEAEIGQMQGKLAATRAKLTVLQADMSKDPDSENKRLLAEYLEQGKRLDAELAKASVQIIDVRDMVALLKAMLEKQSKLKFISLENRPAVAEFVENDKQVTAANRDAEAITIYRHSVVLKMEGSYSSLLSYLQTLEQLPWQFFWQGIEIETESYPNALITLEVYTLGLKQGVIGV